MRFDCLRFEIDLVFSGSLAPGGLCWSGSDVRALTGAHCLGLDCNIKTTPTSKSHARW